MSKDTKEATQHEASTATPTSGNVAPALDYSDSAAVIDKQAEEDATAAEGTLAMTEDEIKEKREAYEATLPQGNAAAPGTEGAAREAAAKAEAKPH